MRYIAGLLLCLALPMPVLAAPKPVPLDGQWRQFVAAPDKPHFDSLYAGVRACRKTCLRRNTPLSDDTIAGLARLIAQRNRLALRLSFAANALIAPDTAALAQSYGAIIRADPTAFLRVAFEEKTPQAIVVGDTAALPDSFAEDNSSQVHELTARRTALARVGDSDLAPLRDVCLARLDADIRRFAGEGGPSKPVRPAGKDKPAKETIT